MKVSRFIRVTRFEDIYGSEHAAYLNVDNISCVEKAYHENGNSVVSIHHYDGMHWILTKETPEEIMELINQC